jgi:hypothetical protein
LVSQDVTWKIERETFDPGYPEDAGQNCDPVGCGKINTVPAEDGLYYSITEQPEGSPPLGPAEPPGGGRNCNVTYYLQVDEKGDPLLDGDGKKVWRTTNCNCTYCMCFCDGTTRTILSLNPMWDDIVLTKWCCDLIPNDDDPALVIHTHTTIHENTGVAFICYQEFPGLLRIVATSTANTAVHGQVTARSHIRLEW